MTNTDFALEMFNNNIENAVKSLIEYINKPNNDVCMEISERRQITDEDARMIIKNLCKINNAIDLQKFNINERNAYLKDLKERYSLSIRQIERLTGISRGVIQKP